MRRMARKAAQRWIDIQPGQVVQAPSGRLRVVRSVSRPLPQQIKRFTAYPGTKCHGHILRKTGVTFVIAHPSWTTRPYTTYNCGELIDLGYRLTSQRVPLRTQFDRLMREDLESSADGGVKRVEELNFKARDVAGIP